jgi:hypothetical protein
LRSAAPRFSFALVAGRKLNRLVRYTGEASTDIGLLFTAIIPENASYSVVSKRLKKCSTEIEQSRKCTQGYRS